MRGHFSTPATGRAECREELPARENAGRMRPRRGKPAGVCDGSAGDLVQAENAGVCDCFAGDLVQAEKLLPQPQLLTALGFSKVKPRFSSPS